MRQIEQMRILAKRMQDDIASIRQEIDQKLTGKIDPDLDRLQWLKTSCGRLSWDIDRAMAEYTPPDFDKLQAFLIAYGRLSRDIERIDRSSFINVPLVDLAGLEFHDAAYGQYEREGFSARTKIEQAVLRGTRVHRYSPPKPIDVAPGVTLDAVYEVPVHHYKEDFWELWSCYCRAIDTLKIEANFG